jgi:hypothetical protein
MSVEDYQQKKLTTHIRINIIIDEGIIYHYQYSEFLR